MAYKQLTTPFGLASTGGLRLATTALGSGTPGSDSAYQSYVGTMQSHVAARDPLVAQLNVAAGIGFDPAAAASQTSHAVALTSQMANAAGMPGN